MTDIQIDKGVPLLRDTRGRSSPWPLREMEMGDSFAFPTIYRDSVNNAMRYAKKTWGSERIYTQRQLGNGTSRCWRTK
jgi:hypothetical protein